MGNFASLLQEIAFSALTAAKKLVIEAPKALEKMGHLAEKMLFCVEGAFRGGGGGGRRGAFFLLLYSGGYPCG